MSGKTDVCQRCPVVTQTATATESWYDDLKMADRDFNVCLSIRRFGPEQISLKIGQIVIKFNVGC